MNNLAGLQVMKIDGLPNLQSIAKDGLPINLVQLSLGSVGGILWNTTWERLTCLSLL
ncbi:CC-NBS-LRR resistance protein, partial [Trifolium medium]|nr:CC-NBS-LRR resistance protein [Trifolium medium]